MAKLMRKIKKSRWADADDLPWLGPGDIQADAIVDLKTSSNSLSVFAVDDSAASVDDVVAALGASSDHLSVIDFALFGEEIAESLDIRMIPCPGDLVDAEVNSWHRDLRELSGRKLLALAEHIKKTAKIERVQPQTVLVCVAEAITARRIDRKQIKWGESDCMKLDRQIAARGGTSAVGA